MEGGKREVVFEEVNGWSKKIFGFIFLANVISVER